MAIENGHNAKEKITLGDATFLLEQENDGCDQGNYGQSLEVKVEDAGGGHYFVLKTERWAVDSPEEMANLLFSIQSKMANWWKS